MLLAFILSFSTQAYLLKEVLTTSNDGKTFIIRHGAQAGITEGVTGTFMFNDAAVIAKAKEVTGELSQWSIINPGIGLPFRKGDYIIYHDAEEYLWTLKSQEEVEAQLAGGHLDQYRRWTFLGHIGKTFSETVSGAVDQEAERTTLGLSTLYGWPMSASTTFFAGGRVESEAIVYEQASLVTQRILAETRLQYDFSQIFEKYSTRMYMGIGGGVGYSQTQGQGFRQRGPAFLLPSAYVGVGVPLEGTKSHFLAEIITESITTRETTSAGDNQNTNQINVRVALGLAWFWKD